jgi:hypothetical protein
MAVPIREGLDYTLIFGSCRNLGKRKRVNRRNQIKNKLVAPYLDWMVIIFVENITEDVDPSLHQYFVIVVTNLLE